MCIWPAIQGRMETKGPDGHLARGQMDIWPLRPGEIRGPDGHSALFKKSQDRRALDSRNHGRALVVEFGLGDEARAQRLGEIHEPFPEGAGNSSSV